MRQRTILCSLALLHVLGGCASESKTLESSDTAGPMRDPRNTTSSTDMGTRNEAASGAVEPAALEPQTSPPFPLPSTPEHSRGTPAPWPADEGIGVASNGGRYWVVYIPPEPEIPLNEDFDLELRVFDGATRTWIADAEVAVDARMPAHGHGMKIDAVAIQNPEGGFDVPGMLLHMTGHWELYVDLTDGALTERAQFDIELE